jgi:DNA-binding transcriptional regulator LsrR (DeoR family)
LMITRTAGGAGGSAIMAWLTGADPRIAGEWGRTTTALVARLPATIRGAHLHAAAGKWMLKHAGNQSPLLILFAQC